MPHGFLMLKHNIMLLRENEKEIALIAQAKCCVCKNYIIPGPAISVSPYNNAVRHLNCVPKSDTRIGKRGRFDRGRVIKKML